MRQHTHLMGKRLLSSALAILHGGSLHCSGLPPRSRLATA